MRLRLPVISFVVLSSPHDPLLLPPLLPPEGFGVGVGFSVGVGVGSGVGVGVGSGVGVGVGSVVGSDVGSAVGSVGMSDSSVVGSCVCTGV